MKKEKILKERKIFVMTESNQTVNVNGSTSVPVVVNMFAGPGAGKSTTAAGMFTLFKIHNGIRCELVTEYAKELVWEERSHTFENQFYLFAKQQHRVWRVANKVDITITDSPILLSNIYGKHYNRYCANDSFYDYVLTEFKRYNNINLFIERKKEYAEYGRNESLEEALKVDEMIKAYLDDNNLPYISIEGTTNGINIAARKVFDLLGYKDLKHVII